jgi:hypothetical protein
VDLARRALEKSITEGSPELPRPFHHFPYISKAASCC